MYRVWPGEGYQRQLSLQSREMGRAVGSLMSLVSTKCLGREEEIKEQGWESSTSRCWSGCGD